MEKELLKYSKNTEIYKCRQLSEEEKGRLKVEKKAFSQSCREIF